MSWESITNAPSGAGGLFVKFADGETRTLIPMGDPHITEKHWPGDDQPKTRIGINVYDCDERSARVWEMSWGVARDVGEEIADSDGGMCAIRVKRRGVGKDTRYKIKSVTVADDLYAAASEEEGDLRDLIEMGFRAMPKTSTIPASPPPLAPSPSPESDDLPF